MENVGKYTIPYMDGMVFQIDWQDKVPIDRRHPFFKGYFLSRSGFHGGSSLFVGSSCFFFSGDAMKAPNKILR